MAKRGRPQQPLTRDQEWAALLLIWRQGRTKEEIAQECGVSRMALWKWEQREDFRKLVDKEYRRMVSAYSRRRRGTRRT